MNLRKRIEQLGLSCLLIGLLAACNTDQLPPDAVLQVSPQTKTITLTATEPSADMGCFVSPDTLYQDIPINVSVTNEEGAPIGDVDVGMYMEYSGNTFSGPQVLQLYADRNGNGVVDGEPELVSGAEDGVYKTKTDKYHGTTMVFVRMNLTCPYKGQLYVFAGTSSATVDFEVQHQGAESVDAGYGVSQ